MRSLSLPVLQTGYRKMNFYGEETYGERVAGVFDDWYGDYDPDTINVLAELAGRGRALELGIGTGRVALPLLARNVEVHGVDSSPAMVDKLRAKPQGDRVPVSLGNFADVSIDGEFALVYVVFNTIFALSSQDEQVRCFRNVAKHLAPRGCFVIEAFVPDVKRFNGGQVNRATKVTADRVELDVGQHDSAEQRVNSQHVVITDGKINLFPVQIRYAYPSELDLMAQLAGLRFRERWSDWQRNPFNSDSKKHISIYERS
ncbi:MAG TPA: class I SAM-dependent methyltransferase [Pyrinomonadaceae bacterium]|nr:class I SAM-dependent methyltransferase [Pyrinomonadaceae bacterium]